MTQGSVTITTPGNGAAPEGHDAAMVARYEAGQAAAAAGLSHIPASAAAAETPPAQAAAPAQATPGQPSAGFVDNLLTGAGLTRDGLSQEFMAQGALSDASYAALEAKGVSRADVDQYLGGLKAQGDAARTEYEGNVIKATVGTAEKYAELTEWAATALTPAQKAAFNKSVSSGDAEVAAFAVAGLQAQYLAANPAEPNLLNQGQVTNSVAGFESWEQVKAEMKKPEYTRDPAFREKVKQRLAVSGHLA